MELCHTFDGRWKIEKMGCGGGNFYEEILEEDSQKYFLLAGRNAYFGIARAEAEAGEMERQLADPETWKDPEAAAEVLKSLSATYGTWAVLGNHDAGATALQMQAYLDSCNIGVLKDEHTVLGGRLVLAGRLDGSPIGGYNGQKRQPLNLEGVDPALPVVVMDHNPAHIDQYGVETDIILCGHTHEGQLFPANIITQAIYAVDYGYYRKDAQSPQVIVTSGLGTWGMPMRVGTKGEIVSIRLQ